MIKWWVDASFALHPDMKSHTSAAMTLDKGTVIALRTYKGSIQRALKKASWWAGINDAKPKIFWTGYFLEAQPGLSFLRLRDLSGQSKCHFIGEKC